LAVFERVWRLIGGAGNDLIGHADGVVAQRERCCGSFLSERHGGRVGLAGAENRVVRRQVRRQGQGEQQSMHRLRSIAAKEWMGVDVFKVV